MEIHKVLPVNLNPTMVRNTLAVYGGLTAETSEVGVLCQSAGNKWSKYKPVRFNNPLNVTDWWKSSNGGCGLDVPVYPNISTMFTALRNNTPMWQYLKPRGLAYNEYYRLLDFVSYDVEAQPPIQPGDLQPKYFAALGTMPVAADINMSGSTELNLSDIHTSINLGNTYFGVAICKSGTTGYKYMTEDTLISTGGDGGFQIPISGELGLYEVVFMLVENKKTSISAPDILNRFVPLEFGYKMVTIEYSPLTVLVSGTWATSQSSWEVVIQNNSNSQINLTGCSMMIRYGDNTEFEPLEFGEAAFTIPIGSDGTITVLPNSTQVVSGTRVNSLPDFNSRDGGLLYFRNNNTAYNAIGQFEM